MAIVSPLPGPEPFSITPMLSSFAQGQQTRMQIDQQQRAINDQGQQALFQAADLAQTPEQWEQFVTATEEATGADLSAFRPGEGEDWQGYREYALGRAMTPYQRASLDISQQQLELQQRAANAPAVYEPRTEVGDVLYDYAQGVYGEPGTQQAIEYRDAVLAPLLETDDGTTPDIQEYEYYEAQERAAGREPVSFGDWFALTRQVGDDVTPTQADQMRAELIGPEVALWGGFLEQEPIVAARQQDLEALELLSQIAPGGPIEGRILQIIGPGWNNAADAMTAIISRLAPTFRVEGSGSTSDIEYQGMLNSLPALSQTQEGRLAVTELMQNKAALDLERAQLVREFQNGDRNETETRNMLAELNRRSIVTPRYRELVGLPPLADEAGEPNADGAALPVVTNQAEYDNIQPGERYRTLRADGGYDIRLKPNGEGP